MKGPQNPFSSLRFERPHKLNIPKSAAIGIGLLVFTLLWWIVPPATLYWLLLPVLGILGWMASFGWRPALVTLHDLLNQLERL